MYIAIANWKLLISFLECLDNTTYYYELLPSEALRHISIDQKVL
jgi:hypothetical protein